MGVANSFFSSKVIMNGDLLEVEDYIKKYALIYNLEIILNFIRL